MVEDRFPFKDSLGHPVDRLVSVIFGKRAPTPLEEACQIVSDFEVFPAGSLAVNVKRDEQLVERFLIQRPFLARYGLNMVLPVEHSSVRVSLE
jgi:hypothetical protein